MDVRFWRQILTSKVDHLAVRITLETPKMFKEKNILFAFWLLYRPIIKLKCSIDSPEGRRQVLLISPHQSIHMSVCMKSQSLLSHFNGFAEGGGGGDHTTASVSSLCWLPHLLAKPKGGIRSLYKWADTAFLALQSDTSKTPAHTCSFSLPVAMDTLFSRSATEMSITVISGRGWRCHLHF